MKAVLSAPKDIITGIFTVRIVCFSEFPLGASHVEFVTLSGDALGGEFAVNGDRQNYQLLYYPAALIVGTSEVRLNGELKAKPVKITYDTHRSVSASFGDPVVRSNRATVPVEFEHAVVGLNKRAFRLTAGRIKYNLYGSGRHYDLVVQSLVSERRRVSVDIVRPVCKATGIMVPVEIVPVEVDV